MGNIPDLEISEESIQKLCRKINFFKRKLSNKEEEIIKLQNKLNNSDILIVAVYEPEQHGDASDTKTIIVNRFKVKAKTKELIKDGYKHFKFFKVIGSIEAEPVKEITHYKIK